MRHIDGDEGGELSAEQVAGYVAKYATKSTEALGVTLDQRVCEVELDHDRCIGRSRAGVVDRLLSVEEAAERLGTSTRFVRRLIFERRIAFVKVGRHVRITPVDLDAFVDAGRVDAIHRAEAG